MTAPLAPLASLDLAPFPARAAGDAIRAYQPQAPALVQMSSGRVHRIDVIQVFADGAIIVETVRQRANGGGDYLRAGRPRWALHTLERYMRPGDAQVLRDAITAAELDYTMRVQMATDPEAGGPRDPELQPVMVPPDDPEDAAFEQGVRDLFGDQVMDDAEPDLPPPLVGQPYALLPEQVRAVVAEHAPHMPQLDAASAEAAGPAYAARERAVTTDPGATVEEVGGRMVFRLTQHGLRQLAEGLGTTTEHFAEVARRSGWQVEES